MEEVFGRRNQREWFLRIDNSNELKRDDTFRSIIDDLYSHVAGGMPFERKRAVENGEWK